MALKCVFLLGLSAYVSGGTIPVAPVAEVSPVLARVEDFDAAPQYSFAYDVQDALTGDSKAQHETRNGDVVQGSYSLIEPDGTRRIVDYTADPINGFNAVVSREPATVAVAPVVARAAIPAAPVAATPVIARVAAPVAPVAPVAAAPVVARTVLPAAPVATAPLVARALPVPVGFPPVAKVSAPVAAAPAIARIAAPLTYAAAGYTI